MVKLQDPADKAAQGLDQFTPVHRNGGDLRSAQGWTVEQWIAYLDRNPSATLPSGVGSMLLQRSRELEKRLQYERDVWRGKHKMTYRLLQNERVCRRQESEMSRHTFFRQTAAVDAPNTGEPYYRSLHHPDCNWLRASGGGKPPCNCEDLPHG